MKTKLILLIGLISLLGCSDNKEWMAKTENPGYLHKTLKTITDRIVYDIFSPPVASRIYAYTTVAAYETSRFSDSSLVSLSGQLNGLPDLPQPEEGKDYCYSLAAIQATYKVGRSLIFSEDVLQSFYENMMTDLKNAGVPRAVWNRSIKFGDTVAASVLAWASKDNYKQSRSFPKYTILNDLSTWKPTPPAYMDAVEPHWNKIRPFVIDSASQFIPDPPITFSKEKGSEFYKMAMEVYAVKKNLTKEQEEIARYWDCNPFMMNVNGHVMFANKKISPGGHWINITKQICVQRNLSVAKSAEAYVRVAISLADAFISCWDEKYRSKLIRPETYINQYIDENWVPVLQTPPFPEDTSGHSTISGSAATALTGLFGDNLAFTDSTELEFGLGIRKFDSFQKAADEASNSRVYGGIHYWPAVNIGIKYGRRIGSFINEKIKTRR